MEDIDILSLLLMISQNIQLFICWKIKNNAFEKFQDFLKEVENQFGRKIKRIRSDRGCEYVQSLGIIYETIAPYSPASNGVPERKNRTLIEYWVNKCQVNWI